MKKHIPLSLALVGLLTLGGVGTAVAVGDNPAPTAGQTLADYMGDDNDAQWDKVQTWVEAEYGDGATVPPAPEPEPTDEPTTDPTTPPAEPTPEPTPTEEPTEAPSGIESGEVTWTETGVTFEGKITGTKAGDRVQIRTDTKELTGQRGFYEYEFVRTDGTVKFTLADYSSPQDKLFWHIARGGGEFAYGDVVANGTVTKPAAEPTPAPEPTTPPADDDSTDGTGGAQTYRTFQSFTANGITGQYHIDASGLDWTKDVGILIYGDGSAEYGLENPSSTYLMGGTNGIREAAKRQNMVLLTPMAPGTNCTDGDGDCWYGNSNEGITPTQKTDWANALIKDVYGKYDIHKDRVALAGYSSGAQWVSQFLAPRHGSTIMTDGVVVPISYGGAPRVTTTFTAAFKDNVVFSWDSGKNDAAYSTASYGAIGGYNWYKSNGFTAEANWIDGKGHGRSGEFGGVVEREIKQHVRPTS